MTGIRWDLAANNGFQNSLSHWYQMGRDARQRQERRDYRNALGVLAQDPEDREALTSVFQHDPRVGIALMDRADENAFSRAATDYLAPGGGAFNEFLGMHSHQTHSPFTDALRPSHALEPSASVNHLPAATRQPVAAPQPAQPQPSDPTRATAMPQAEQDLSFIGTPRNDADRAFLEMLGRDPMRAIQLRSELRDNFMGQIEAESEFYGLAMGELSRATDQAGWQAGLRAIMPRARALNINLMQHVPGQFPGPDGVRQLMERAQPIKEQLDRMLREGNIEADNIRADRNTDSLIETRDRRAGEYERHNRASEANQRRGQDMTDRRVRSGRGRRSRGSQAGSDIPTVASPAEAQALPSGTRFRTPDGREKVRP